MNQYERAEAAITLLRHAMRTDNQNGVDLLTGLIGAEGLFRFYADDAGEPFDNLEDFGEELNRELAEYERGSGRVSANAGRASAAARRSAEHQSLQVSMSRLDAAMAAIRR